MNGVSRAEPTICAIMVSYHTGPVLFQAVQACLDAPDIDLLVLIDNGNPPEVSARLAALAKADPRMRHHDAGANLGFAKGCNIGAGLASGDRLLFLNPDAVIPPGAAARMAETGAGLPEPWIVGARILNPDGSEQRGARRGELTLASAMAGFLGLRRVVPGLRDVHRECEPVPAAAEPVPVVSGAAMMLSRSGFQKLGGFDEGYFLHVEDIDICRRARMAGGAVVFEPRAELLHRGSTSRASLLVVEMHKARGLQRYFLKFSRGPERALAALAMPLIMAAMAVRVLAVQARRVFGSRPRGGMEPGE